MYLVITALLINIVPAIAHAEAPPLIIISDKAYEHHNKMILNYESYMLDKYGKTLKISAIADACGHRDIGMSIVYFDSDTDVKAIFEFDNGMVNINQGVIVGETIMRQLIAYRNGVVEGMSNVFEFSTEAKSLICEQTMKMIRDKKLAR